jgi:predicted dinucleotide-binding enzyme
VNAGKATIFPKFFSTQSIKTTLINKKKQLLNPLLLRPIYKEMKIGILGTGTVGTTIASALVNKGHSVMLGSRTRGSEKGRAWVDEMGEGASEGSFPDAAIYGEMVFICLNGEHAIAALQTLDPTSVQQKILIDITNPLDFSQGMPPQILEAYRSISLAEKIQETLPHSFIIKTLNTVNYKLMVDAREVAGGDHSLFICGNNGEAKEQVKDLLIQNFHWLPESFVDLGTIAAARTMEAIVPFWVLVYRSIGTPLFNFKIVS